MLRAAPEAATPSALARATGHHPNTVREHLEALVGLGLVRRRPAVPAGRGRPAWRYEAVAPSAGEGAVGYAGLATVLAAVVRSSGSPWEAAIAAGVDWGHELARQSDPPPAPDPSAARDQVVALLSDLGFAHETDAATSTVRLTTCPLLEAARRYPEVVCGVHLGLVRGALARLGVDGSASALHPFSEPGGCRLDLTGGSPA